jgi:hypothetical protein
VKAERSLLSLSPQNFSEPNTLHWCVTCTEYIKLRAQWTSVPVRPYICVHNYLTNFDELEQARLSFWASDLCSGDAPFRISPCTATNIVTFVVVFLRPSTQMPVLLPHASGLRHIQHNELHTVALCTQRYQ